LFSLFKGRYPDLSGRGILTPLSQATFPLEMGKHFMGKNPPPLRGPPPFKKEDKKSRLYFDDGIL